MVTMPLSCIIYFVNDVVIKQNSKLYIIPLDLSLHFSLLLLCFFILVNLSCYCLSIDKFMDQLHRNWYWCLLINCSFHKDVDFLPTRYITFYILKLCDNNFSKGKWIPNLEHIWYYYRRRFQLNEVIVVHELLHKFNVIRYHV